ncbi:MAG: hypothetical protein HY300_01350 [Verrucomicrobia bacterium]|nr:hypothetical protein [Verrucomicrobiota bacterium]
MSGGATMHRHSDKLRRLRALARKRKRARWEGFKGIGDYFDGYYECNHVSPYTKTACNVDSPIVVMLQDWTSDTSIRRGRDPETKKFGYTPGLRTNTKLADLLEQYFSVSLKDIYGTNLFPFIKLGDMGATIPQADLVRAAQEFAIPQIEVIRPRLVICLGLATFNALRRGYDLEPVYPIDKAIRTPFNTGETLIWCQAHTGVRGQNNRNRGGKERVPNDWKRMRKLARIKVGRPTTRKAVSKPKA